jgi:hypothetical protein
MCLDIRVFACLDIFLDLVCGVGWNGDNQNITNRRANCKILRTYIEDRTVCLYLPFPLVTSIYANILHLYNSSDALAQIAWIVELSHCNVTVDQNILCRKAIPIAQELGADLIDVLYLLNAYEAGGNYFLTDHSLYFQNILEHYTQGPVETNMKVISVGDFLFYLDEEAGISSVLECDIPAHSSLQDPIAPPLTPDSPAPPQNPPSPTHASQNP